jgi:lipoyl(octanoyl) transferase
MENSLCQVFKLGRIPYQSAWKLQLRLVRERRSGERGDAILFLEHDNVYTIGRAGSRSNIKVSQQVLDDLGIQVIEVDRGGDITYHGPGQLVSYPIFDLTLHGKDMHRYVRLLEKVMIQTIACYGIFGFREAGLTGVWTEKGKIGAIGVGVKGWVSMHGVSLNVHPNMQYFSMINPCGLTDRAVTCMADFGVHVDIEDVRQEMERQFAAVFAVKIIPMRGIEDGYGKTGVAENQKS